MITKPPAHLDSRRRLDLEAYVCRIDDCFRASPAPIPGVVAESLLRRLIEAGLASIAGLDDETCLTMLGVKGSSTGGAYGILSNWQNNAKILLAENPK